MGRDYRHFPNVSIPPSTQQTKERGWMLVMILGVSHLACMEGWDYISKIQSHRVIPLFWFAAKNKKKQFHCRLECRFSLMLTY